MRLIDRLRARTPRKNKRRGQILTAVGTAASITLMSGVVTAPFGLIALAITAVLTGGIAFSDATKFVKNEKEEEK